ncbi:MAG TPA: DUF1289 domain-containing protein [Motiliproteus sp.]
MTKASPCIRHCCLDEADICLGCYRSLAEILQWGEADAHQRQTILDRAALRREQHHQRLVQPLTPPPTQR